MAQIPLGSSDTTTGDPEMLAHLRSARFMAAVAGGVSGFALAYPHGASAQQAAQPEDGAGLEEILVAGQPTSVQLLEGPRSAPSDLSTNGGTSVAEAKMPTRGVAGFIEGAIGNYGQKAIGGEVTLPLVEGKVLLRVDAFESHTDAR